MTCTNPRLIRRRVPDSPSKLGIVYRDEGARLGDVIEVPCGQCMACRIRRSTEWSCRILHEITLSDSQEACFVTLTIDDMHLRGDSLIKRSVQLFIKRLRKAISPQKIKYYAVGEYGDLFERPHYHLIIIGWTPDSSDLIMVGEDSHGHKRWRSKFIQNVWPYGFNTVGNASGESVDYCTGYVQKKLTGQFAQKAYGSKVPPFALISQGLGARYVDTFQDKLNEDLYCVHKGNKVNLPRYYMNRMRVDKARLEELRLKREQEKEVKYKDLLGLNGKNLLYHVELDERKSAENALRAQKKMYLGVEE